MSDQETFENASLWRPWSIGIVTKDKPFGTDIISVTAIERLPEQSGDLANDETVFEGAVSSPLGGTNAQEVKGSANITAHWVPNGMDHLFTSPMVRANETVQLWKYADQPKVYWSTIFREPSIRRTERFIFAAGNLSAALSGSLDLDSIYSIDVDTVDKKITIKTSTSDGETYAYQLQMNAKEGWAGLQDNIGRKVIIDSVNDNVFMEDVAGAVIETRAGFPRIYGPNGILLETPSQLHIKSGNTLVDGPTKFNDSVDIKKNLAVASGFTSNYDGSGGEAVMNGNVRINGGLTVTQYANFPGGHGPH